MCGRPARKCRCDLYSTRSIPPKPLLSGSTSLPFSPRRVARPARCREMRRFRPRGPATVPSAVRRWGSRAEVKARGGVDARASSTTSNEEIGRDPHRPEGLRRHRPVFVVVAPRRWRDIAVVAAPEIRGHGARNGRRWGLRPGLAGRGVVLDSTSSTPKGENAADCGISRAAVATW